jgi:hypothetical protein
MAVKSPNGQFQGSDGDFENKIPLVPVAAIRRYNVRVNSPLENKTRSEHTSRHHVYALEATGLLIIAATLLTITLVRYWYALHWSLR